MQNIKRMTATVGLAFFGSICSGLAVSAEWTVQEVIRSTDININPYDAPLLNNLGQVAGTALNANEGYVTGPNGIGLQKLLPSTGNTFKVLSINDSGRLLAFSSVDWIESPTAAAFVSVDTLDSTDYALIVPARWESIYGQIDNYGNALINGSASLANQSKIWINTNTLESKSAGNLLFNNMFSKPLFPELALIYDHGSPFAKNDITQFKYMDSSYYSEKININAPAKGTTLYPMAKNSLGQIFMAYYGKSDFSVWPPTGYFISSPPYKSITSQSLNKTKTGGAVPTFAMNNFGEVVSDFSGVSSGVDGAANTSDVLGLPQSIIYPSALRWRATVNDWGQRLAYDSSNDKLLLLTPPPANCEVTYAVDRIEADRYWATLTVTNLSTTPLEGWRLALHHKVHVEITRKTNAAIRSIGATVVVLPTKFNRTISPMSSVTSSYVGVKGADTPIPSVLVGKVNAGVCHTSIL